MNPKNFGATRVKSAVSANQMSEQLMVNSATPKNPTSSMIAGTNSTKHFTKSVSNLNKISVPLLTLRDLHRVLTRRSKLSIDNVTYSIEFDIGSQTTTEMTPDKTTKREASNTLQPDAVPSEKIFDFNPNPFELQLESNCSCSDSSSESGNDDDAEDEQSPQLACFASTDNQSRGIELAF